MSIIKGLAKTTNGNVEVAVATAEGYSSVTGHGDNGHDLLEQVYDKAIRFTEKYGRDPKYVILDSQTYLDIYAYLTLRKNDGFLSRDEVALIYSPTGPLTPIVLPQKSKRLQVVGEPMFTATETLSDR